MENIAPTPRMIKPGIRDFHRFIIGLFSKAITAVECP
jgi:hypothetical protein